MLQIETHTFIHYCRNLIQQTCNQFFLVSDKYWEWNIY